MHIVAAMSLLLALVPSSKGGSFNGAVERPLTADEALDIVKPDLKNPSVGRNTLAMAGIQRIPAAWQAVMHVSRLSGDIVEAGVYRGGTSMVMAWAEMVSNPLYRRHPNRTLWLFDTFEGLPPPTHELDDPRAKRQWANAQSAGCRKQSEMNLTDHLQKVGCVQRGENATSDRTRAFEHGTAYTDTEGIIRWNYGPIDEVRRNMASTGYPMNRVRFIKGKVEDTLMAPENVPARIAVLRLDTDWFTSTKTELDVLFPRLISGGFLIIDDYCSWGGSRSATDSWLRKNRKLLREETIRDGARHSNDPQLCFMAQKK